MVESGECNQTMDKKKVNKIKLGAVLFGLLILLEFVTRGGTVPITEMCITGIAELIKGMFLGTVFTLFIEEEFEEKKK